MDQGLGQPYDGIYDDKIRMEGFTDIEPPITDPIYTLSTLSTLYTPIPFIKLVIHTPPQSIEKGR